MKISQIIQETTTSGSVATVTQPLLKGAVTRNPSIYGKQGKPSTMFKGKVTNKPFVNSISESAIKEEEISEQDLIVVPGQGRLKRTGFVKHDLDRGESEGETLKNSLHTIIRTATHLDKALNVQDSFPEWVSEKVGAVKSMMVSVMDYLISSQEMQHDPDAMEGIAGGLLGGAAAAAIAPEVPGSMSMGYKAGSAIQDTFATEGKEELHAKLQAINHKLKMMRGGPVDRPNSVAFVEKRQALMKQKKEIEAQLKQDMKEGSEQRKPDLSKIRTHKLEELLALQSEIGRKDPRTKASADLIRAELKKRGVMTAEGKIDFAKKLQKNIDKSNKAVVKTRQEIGHRIADIGPSGKEHNVQTNKAWDDANKVKEGAKVDRMVKHIEKSEEKAGKSKKEAENIAWATANKRGMLNNRNKK